MRYRPLRVVLLGAGQGRLRSMLEEALTQGRARCELVPPAPGEADIVVAVVRTDAAHETIAAARTIARQAPVIAVLPRCDEDLALQVLQRGAQGWYSVDAPMDLLRSMVVALAGGGESVRGRSN
jgi:DNA-binding NarL/FixJ family response regulator